MENHEAFLSFNGKTIYFTTKSGENWIAIKPICEALGVDYIRQFKNLKEDDFYNDALSKQTMRDTKNRRQKMASITEKYVYGWIASIRSESKQLQDYKRTCYELLYNHFHGVITGRREILLQKRATKSEIAAIKGRLEENEDFKQLEILKSSLKYHTRELRKNDTELMEQPKLF